MNELADKMAKLGPLYAALDRAKAALAVEKSPAAAVFVQQMQQQIAALRKTLPAVRLATG